MDPKVQQLVHELEQYDPSFRAQREAVIRILEALLVTRPAFVIDDLFRQELRRRLVAESAKPAGLPWYRRPSAWLVPAGAMALASIAVVLWLPKTAITPEATDGRLRILSAGNEAFGPLTAASSDTPQSFGGSPKETQAGGGSDLPTSSVIAAPDYVFPIYEYDGPLVVPNLPVLKRERDLGDNFNDLVRSATLGIIDLKAFDGLTVQQVTLAGSEGSGYSVSVDRVYGQVTITRTMPDRGMKAIGAEPINAAGAVLSDQAMINAANDFLRRFGISRDGLGEPIVQRTWLRYTLANEPSYTPTEIPVVYPWVINGVPVVNDSGDPYGLSVQVNTSEGSVVSIFELIPLTFTASEYALVDGQNSDLRRAIRSGGVYGGEPTAGSLTKAYQLSDPAAVYVVSQFQLGDRSTTFLVPALQFPIVGADQQNFHRPAVVVPVVQELLELPVLTIEPAASGSSGSGTATVPSTTDIPGPVEDLPLPPVEDLLLRQ